MKPRLQAVAVFAWLAFAGNPLPAAEYAIGAGLSFLKQVEERGTIFKDGTNARPVINVFDQWTRK